MEEHFVVCDDGAARIRATVCQRCGSRWFPARDVCATCRDTPLEPLFAGPTATVYAATTVWAGAPGFTVPYGLAYIDVEGLRVLTHVQRPEGQDSPPRPGTRVLLRADVIDGLSRFVAFPDGEGSGGDA
jgi:hypothetical protein